MLFLGRYVGTVTISTHTLTWSVTDKGRPEDEPTDISTHTLTWSVTMRTIDFNRRLTISTHTLTWSVTYATRSPLLS